MTKRILSIGLLLMMALGASAHRGEAKAEKPAKQMSVAGLQKALSKNPGDLNMRCELVGMLLAEGDTAKADEMIAYGLKLSETDSCLLFSQAAIDWARGRKAEAAINLATAVSAGASPRDNAFFSEVLTSERMLIESRLKMVSKTDKTNASALSGLSYLSLLDGDTAKAISYLSEAWQRSQDSTYLTRRDSLQSRLFVDTTDTVAKAVVARIPFTKKMKTIELRCTLKETRIRAVVDTAATENTISGVEIDFLLKNEYILQSDIIDGRHVILSRLELEGGVVLRDVRLAYRKNQEEPLILCLGAFNQLGKAAIDDEKKEIVITE